MLTNDVSRNYLGVEYHAVYEEEPKHTWYYFVDTKGKQHTADTENELLYEIDEMLEAIRLHA